MTKQSSMPLQGGTGIKQWSLADGIAEIKREQFHRGRVYPRLIAGGQLAEIDANKQNAALQGTLTFMEYCLQRQDRLRAFMAAEAKEAAP